MIEVKHLYKSFGDKEVLKDINAVFEDGKTNLIIGQSGSGKTVLIKNLVGLLEPTSGEVLYDNRNFVTMSKKEKVFSIGERDVPLGYVLNNELSGAREACTGMLGPREFDRCPAEVS